MAETPFGPGHPEFCPQSKDEAPGTHCDHWWEAEPCCWCGTDEGAIGDGACTCDGVCDGPECRYCAQDPKGRCPAIW